MWFQWVDWSEFSERHYVQVGIPLSSCHQLSVSFFECVDFFQIQISYQIFLFHLSSLLCPVPRVAPFWAWHPLRSRNVSKNTLLSCFVLVSDKIPSPLLHTQLRSHCSAQSLISLYLSLLVSLLIYFLFIPLIRGLYKDLPI